MNIFIPGTFGNGVYVMKVVSLPNVIGDENFCHQKVHFVSANH